MIRHAVFLKVRSSVSASELDSVFTALAGLKHVIPGILSISIGRDVSPEGLQRGHSHGFTVDFADAAARDAYLPHPAHQKVGAMIVAVCEGGLDGVTVVDWDMPA